MAVADVDVERCRAWLGLAAGLRVTDRFDEAFAAEALGHRSGAWALALLHQPPSPLDVQSDPQS